MPPSKDSTDTGVLVLIHDRWERAGNVVVVGRRLPTARRLPGWMTAPGGWLKEGETPIAGALRELKEEAGLVVQPSALRPLAMTRGIGASGAVTTHTFALHVVDAAPFEVSRLKGPDPAVEAWTWARVTAITQRTDLTPELRRALKVLSSLPFETLTDGGSDV